MADGFQVDAAQIRRHIAGLEAVRSRFGAVKSASAAISQDDGAYGLLCSWLPAVLEGRHRRQDELLAYVEENLTLAADSLTAVAGDYEDTDNAAADAVRKAGMRLDR
ncbi:type VII secretion target [Actinoplanes friuliensis]|uniref:Excreted virulence factor EspC, type VII ESX diderm n=1 Tax=Actinoplanes friuliensis DSM 7358 TaxID=1246995 RepID=U5WES2_9ACTN|nr:type VII secretion target [Actinoplanes friuliensis]AGZ46446.1 hypothetical protein AFR_40960 [Actinoplanes friuliensis DSM 7358]